MVYPGEEKLKRRLMWKLWGKMFLDLLRKIFGKQEEQKDQKSPNNADDQF
jgi:hypothetical protein